MASIDSREEEHVLLAVDESSPAPHAVSRPNHKRDLHVLSVSFLLVFLAYSAAQNLESTLNSEDDLGTTSLGILYLSFTFFSLVASPIVKSLGSRNALILGTTGYWLFIASNLLPKWYTMIPASLYLGFTASIVWVGQGTYLTSAACSHANEHQLQEGTVIGDFNGEFWGIFSSTQVIGNLFSFLLLKNKKDGGHISGTTLLFVVFLGCMTIGSILMCFLSRHDTKRENTPTFSKVHSILGAMHTVLAPLLCRRMLLLIPLLAYSGLQQAFVWSEFTKYVVTPTLGISGVRGAMTLYGACDAICSLVAGRLASNLVSITLIVCAGVSFQIIIILWLLLQYSTTSGLSGILCPLIMAAVWGVGDGIFNTQINALLGMLFKHDMEAAFAQLKVWQSAATAIVFFLSPYIAFQAMLVVMISVICVALSGFLVLTLKEERAFSGGS